MKLQKLIIENIASIEKACIDFEHGPLGEDSIFLSCWMRCVWHSITPLRA